MYIQSRCTDTAKLIKLVEDAQIDVDWYGVLMFVLFFHLIGRIAVKPDDPNVYIIATFGLFVWDDVYYSISYNSDYGEVPEGKSVTEGYMLEDYDLPVLEGPEGYTFGVRSLG